MTTDKKPDYRGTMVAEAKCEEVFGGFLPGFPRLSSRTLPRRAYDFLQGVIHTLFTRYSRYSRYSHVIHALFTGYSHTPILIIVNNA